MTKAIVSTKYFLFFLLIINLINQIFSYNLRNNHANPALTIRGRNVIIQSRRLFMVEKMNYNNIINYTVVQKRKDLLTRRVKTLKNFICRNWVCLFISI